MKRTFTTFLSGILLVMFLTSVTISQVDLKTDHRYKTHKMETKGKIKFFRDMRQAEHGRESGSLNKPPFQTDAGDPTEADLMWAGIYSSPYSDFAQDIAIDALGNSYVLGFDWNEFVTVLIKYNSSGDSVWVVKREMSSTSVAVDDLGYIYISGNDSNACLAKYDNSGQEVWTSHFQGPQSFDYFTTVKIDASGNPYVSGFSLDIGFDMVVAKYDQNGNNQWVCRYPQPDNFDVFSFPIPLALDQNGNAYAVNMLLIDPVNFENADYLTIKVNSAGNLRWARAYDAYGMIEFPNAIATDRFGNVFVTGSITNQDFRTSYGTVKYNTSGVFQWARQHDYSGYGGIDIETDFNGNAYVTGGSNDSIPNFYEDYVTIKYSPAGDSLWVKRYEGIIPSGDLAWALDLDIFGNVYVTGMTSSLNDLWWEYGTVAYDLSGNQLWTQRYASATEGDNRPNRIIADDMGNVYVTGTRYLDTTYQDFLTLRYYQPHVNPVELSSFNFNLTGNDVELFWTTVSETLNSGFSIERANVKNQVEEDWNQIGFVQGHGNSVNPVSYSFSDRGLNAGKYRYRLKQIDFNGNFEYFNLSSEVNIGVPVKYELSQNYPNPFNPSTIIRYAIPSDAISQTSNVKLIVYDILGNEIATLVNEKQEAGNYSVTFNGANFASGIYCYRIESGSFADTKKMMLIK